MVAHKRRKIIDDNGGPVNDKKDNYIDDALNHRANHRSKNR